MSSSAYSSSDDESSRSSGSNSSSPLSGSRSRASDGIDLDRATDNQAESAQYAASPADVGASTSSGRRGPASHSLDEVDEAFLSSLSGRPTTCTFEGVNVLPLGDVDARIPEDGDRPWRAPEGYFTVYEGYFLVGLRFPLPELLLDYCDKRKVALSQLSPSSVHNLLMLQKFGQQCGVEIDLPFFEGVTSMSEMTNNSGLFYVKMKPGAGIITGAPNKIRDWKFKFFYVKKNEASLLDCQRAIRSCWSRDVGRFFCPFAIILLY